MNGNNFDKKENYDKKQENALVKKDDAFNDSFFKRDEEFHNTNEATVDTEIDDKFSYSQYEQEKKLAYGQEIDVEKGSHNKLFITMFSAGAIGIIGYLGFNYLQDDKKPDSQPINIAKNIEENSSKKVAEVSEVSKDREIKEIEKKETEEKKVDNISVEKKKETLIKEKPTPVETPTPTPMAKETPISIRQKEMIESVIKTLKEKKKNSVAPTPAEVIESVKKEIKKNNDKSQVIKSVEKKKSKIVTKKIKKEKPKKPQYKVVIVKKGDTLASIAKKFYGNPMEFKRIIRANRDIRRASSHLHLGQKIIVPIVDHAKKRRLVVIRKGDTLASIAKRFYGDHRKFQRIIDANYKIKNEHTRLHLGQVIYVPR